MRAPPALTLARHLLRALFLHPAPDQGTNTQGHRAAQLYLLRGQVRAMIIGDTGSERALRFYALIACSCWYGDPGAALRPARR